MKRIFKLAASLFAAVILLFAMIVVADWIPYPAAKPPKAVTDVASCLNWLKRPLGAYRVTVRETEYYLILGPAGRLLASERVAYSFDAQGRFIDWTEDMGDFKTPPEVFAPGAKREVISLDELRRKFAFGSSNPSVQRTGASRWDQYVSESQWRAGTGR